MARVQSTDRNSRALRRGRPTAHTLDERVAAAHGRLAPGQERVAAYFAEHRDEVAFLSAAEIGATISVSDATVIRTTQALGYAGLAELKAEFREALRRRTAPSVRYERSIEFLSTDQAELLDHLIADQIDNLNEARRSLRVDDYRQAVGLLAGSDRIVVHGAGLQGPLAEYLALIVRRFGRHAHVISETRASLVDTAVELRTGDVLVVIIYERSTPDVDLLLALSRKRQIPVVLVTDTLALALKGRYTVALVARRGSSTAATTITVPLVIVDALLLGVAAVDRERTRDGLAEFRQLRARLGLP